MATLNATKYPNNERTISGLTNFVLTDDVVLNCNTTLAPVRIELAQIPAQAWSTTYVLYINDLSGNASTNNITIVAPTGFTINNAHSIIINVDGGQAFIKIQSDTSYIATFNYSSVGNTTVTVNNTNHTVTMGVNNVGSNYELSADIADTGWLDMNGFNWIVSPALKPQYRIIGKQIVFRRNIVIPLDNGSGSVINYNGTNYDTQTLKAPFTGSGGVTLNSQGSITFNNGNPVLQDPTHYPDTTYSTGFIIATRRAPTDNVDVVAGYTTLWNVVITSSGTMLLGMVKDFEIGNGVNGGTGQSNMRYLVSQAISGNTLLDYTTITEVGGATPATLIGNPTAPSLNYKIAQNPLGAKHQLTLDAGTETDLGAFSSGIGLLSAYRN